MRRPLLALSCICAASGAAASARIILPRGTWAAIDRGATCEALGRAARVAAKGKVQAVAGFTFSADRRRWGEFHVQLRRMPRAGTSVLLRAGGETFLLASRGNLAWTSGPAQDRAIIAALRSSAAISVEARDGSGRRFVDNFGSAGAPTAIDAAAAACAGKVQPH